MFANGGKISASVLLSSAFILNSYQVFVIPDVISSSTVFATPVNKYGLTRDQRFGQAVLDVKEGKIVDFTELNNLIDNMENAANVLLEKLPNDILNESKVMLEQFKRIAKADRIAALSLKNNKLDSELKNMRQEIKDNDSKARISELSALLFIDEVIELFGI